MTVFEVQAPDGKTYEVDAPSVEEAEAELKNFHSDTPGPLMGTWRAFDRGMLGDLPNQINSFGDQQELQNQKAKDTAFSKEYPNLSALGGLAGRGVGYVAPIVLGRRAGSAAASGIRPQTTPRLMDPISAGAQAADLERQAVQNQYAGMTRAPRGTIGPEHFMQREMGTRVGLARAQAADAATRANAQAQEAADRANRIANTLKGGMTFGGGIAGGAAGGAGEAYLHKEDPQMGALYGAAGGVLPSVVKPITGKSVPHWLSALGGYGLAGALEAGGAPKWMIKPFEDFGLGKNPGWGDRK